MNGDTKHPPLPSLVGTVLTDGNHDIDNLLAAAWKTLRLNQLLLCAGFSKRHGVEVTETVFVLMVWKWLNVASTAMFCRHALDMFSRAKEVYKQQGLDDSRVKALVLDDSVKARRGKKMEGVSSHDDHVTSRHVMGQQVLTLGLATDDAFLPLDSQLYVSRTKAQALSRPYKDSCSVAARRYREGTTQSKPEMGIGMMRRAKRSGLDADYLVADAWFGTKTMIRATYSAADFSRSDRRRSRVRGSRDGRADLLNEARRRRRGGGGAGGPGPRVTRS